jgi:hypothetical protein
MNPLTVKTLETDYTLNPDDNLSMLYYTEKGNLRLTNGVYPAGFMCFVVCSRDKVGSVIAANGVMVNGFTGGQAIRSLVGGVSILAQPVADNWTLALAEAG